MSSPFQRYQGGGFEIPNIAQAGANIGQMYQRGMESFGESIGKGIQAYQAGIMQNQTADAKLAAAIRNTGMLAASLADHPDYQNIAGELAGKIEEYKKAPGKGLGAKLAAINDLETIGQTVTQSIQYQNQAAEARALQAYNETPETKRVVANETLLQYGYRPGDQASLNRALGYAVRKVQEANEASGFKPGDANYNEPSKVLQNLLGEAKTGIADALKADPKNVQLINAEKELSGAIKQFSAAFGATAALQAGAKDIEQFAGQAVEGFGERSAAETAMRPPADLDVRVDAAKKRQAEAETGLAETKKRLEEGNFTKMPVAETVSDVAGTVGDWFTRWYNNQYSMRSRARINKMAGGGEITPEKARLLVKEASDGLSPEVEYLFGNAANQMLGSIETLGSNVAAIADMINPVETLTEKEKQNIAQAWTEVYGKKGKQVVEAGGFNAADELKNNQLVYQRQIEEAKKEQAAVEAERGKFTQKTVDLQVEGNVARDQQIGSDERVALARDALAKSDFVRTRFGGKIPAAALQALQSKILQPPQMVTDPATGARLYQSAPGRWEQLKVESDKEGISRVNMPLFRPGHESVVGGKQVQYQISGAFKGSEKEKGDFIATTQKRARALTSIDRLIEINSMTGESLRPELIGEAQTIVNEIISSNRVDLIGPGQVAVAEWQMLEKLVRDPSKLVELDSVTRANLTRLRQRMENVMDDEAYAKGVMLTKAQSGAEIGRNARVQALLNR